MTKFDKLYAQAFPKQNTDNSEQTRVDSAVENFSEDGENQNAGESQQEGE